MAGLRIGIIMDNSVEMVTLLLDIWEQGNVPVLIDCKMPFKTCITMLKESGAEQCYINDMLFESWNVNEFPLACQLIPISIESANPSMLNKSTYDRFKMRYSNDEGIVFFSSGTTNLPKGIVLSHNAISHTIDAIIDYMQPQKEDLFLIVKSLIHSSTMVGELLVALKCKIPVVLLSTIYSPRVLLQAIEKHKPSIIFVNPTLLALLCRGKQMFGFSCSSIKVIYTSGAIASPKLLREAEELFESASIYNVYGLTEAGPRITAQKRGESNTIGGVGKAIKNIEIKIVNQKGEICSVRQEGVIQVKTPGKMMGYIINGCVINEKEDWLITNDIGYLDENQELYVLGRKDNMIIRNGHNVYPSYIENILYQTNLLTQCVVFGVEDPIEGQRIVSFIVLNQEYKNNNIAEMKRKIINHCSQYLAQYEMPQEIFVRECIPSTTTGKVSFSLVKEEYSQLEKTKNVTE